MSMRATLCGFERLERDESVDAVDADDRGGFEFLCTDALFKEDSVEDVT